MAVRRSIYGASELVAAQHASDSALYAPLTGSTAYAPASAAPQSVLALGAKGDVVTVTDAAITASQSTVSSTAAAFTSANVGQYVQVVGAGTAWNDRGAWASATSYAFGDKVTNGGVTYICGNAHTSPTVFAVQNWKKAPSTTAGTLMAKILSVSGGVATLDAAAGTTVSGATCTYGTDDSPVITALPAGDYVFPGGRTYFLADWFMPSNVNLTFGFNTTFKIPYYSSTDVRVFGLMTSNRQLTSYVSDIYAHGLAQIDMSELTPPSGSIPRGVQVGNCEKWSVEAIVGRGIPGTTGNVFQNGAGSGGTQPRNGKVGIIRNENVRGVGSSCVQHTGGTAIEYGLLWCDGGVGLRIEMDNQPGISDNVTCHSVYANGDSGFPNTAVMTAAHDNIIRNIRVGAILCEGGADGWIPSYNVGTGEVTAVEIGRGRVVGGGAYIRAQTGDATFPGCTVIDGYVSGTLTTSLHDVTGGGAVGAGFQVARGMTLVNPTATRCAAQGIADSSQSTIVAGGLITIINPRVSNNVGPGMQFSHTERVVITSGQSGQNTGAGNVALQTYSGTMAPWKAGSGASAVSGASSILTVTADGTQTFARGRTGLGTGGIPVTPGRTYRIDATATRGTAASGSPALATLWFYKNDGTSTDTPNGSTPTAVTTPLAVTFTYTAPADAAYMAVVLAFQDPTGGHLVANGATMAWSGVVLSEVFGAAAQTYGLQADTGVTVDYFGTDFTGNATGTTNGVGTMRPAGSTYAALGFAPPSGGFQLPANVATTTTGSPTSGTIYFVPFDVGPAGLSYNGIGVGVTTAQVGGTTTTTIGLYPDDGTGGQPKLVGGPLASGTIVLTSLGNAVLSVTTATLAPGRYWGAFLYKSTVGPGTNPVLNTINQGVPLANQSGITIGTTNRGWALGGQSALPSTAQTLVGINGSVTPIMAIQAA